MSFLTKTFNPAASGNGNNDALGWAVMQGRTDVVETLLKRGANVNDPASGTYLDNQADGFKSNPPDFGAASPDSQADGYKEADVQTGHAVTTMKPLTFGRKAK